MLEITFSRSLKLWYFGNLVLKYELLIHRIRIPPSLHWRTLYTILYILNREAMANEFLSGSVQD